MDLAQRLNHLESVRDWQGLAEELERAIVAEPSAAVKASYHLKLGRVLEDKFLLAVKALKHFQDAFKLNPALIEALQQARAIYWDLGKTNMVQKLLELELKNAQEGPAQTAILLELGDVLTDLGDQEKAASTYARALASSGGESDAARDGLADMQVDAGSAPGHLEALVEIASLEDDVAARSRLFLRASRVAKRYSPTEVEGLLTRAYEADPGDKQAAAIFEQLMMEEDRSQAIAETQRRVLAAHSGTERAAISFRFGVRWATRHQNHEIGSQLLESAFESDPSNEAAFAYLRELWGTKQGDWDRVIQLAERAADANPTSPFLVAQAGTILWRQGANLMRARAWFERLVAIAPDHPSLRAFEAQIGEHLGAPAPGAADDAAVDVVVASEPPPAPIAPASEPPPAPARAASEPPPPVSAAYEPPPVSAAPEPVAAPAPTLAPPPVSEPVVASKPSVNIDELIVKAQKQEQAKRYNEYVKTLIEIAEAVDDPAEKIDYYAKAADLYTTKFSNAAEAVKCFEAILALDGEHAQAIDFLRQSYEKRRDWEKLIGLMKREAGAMPEGAARGAKFLEVAKLATERVKKPEVCIDLWNEVIANDPENAEALNALAGLHERAKDWPAFASVLQKQVDSTFESVAKQNLLGKIGALYGERLNDDEAAVEAWRQLLALNPQDRKAQEALKKKYLTLGRWDDLEVFYAESG